MAMPWRLKQRLAAACVVVATLVAALTAWRAFRPVRHVAPFEWRSMPHLSEEFNASMTELIDVAFSRQLSDERAEFVMTLLDRHLPALPERPVGSERTPDDEEATFAVGYAYDIMGERLRFGGISEETRLKFSERLVAGLDSTKYEELMSAIQQCCYSKLVADEAVRQRVIRLQSHADKMICSQAVRQLAHYDKIADLERRGRWPRERPPAYWR
ncbi:MAG: hypothetical protein IBJ10_02040 [Phycisphaerales bacterium]|nr:hypothetical protein [Phycisphaerales bacterium]